jgi:mycothiol synthase
LDAQGTIHLVHSPLTLSFRPLDPDQVPQWAGLLAAIEAEDHQQIHMTEQELLEEFDDPDRDFPRGSVAVYHDAVMVGYGVLTCRSEADPVHNMYQEGGVHPAYRCVGSGSTLLEWAERAAVPLHQERFGGHPLALHGTCATGNEPAVVLHARHGYRQQRWFHLMRAEFAGQRTRGPVKPENRTSGAQIAGYSAARSQDALLVRNEAFRDHWGSTEDTPATWAHITGSSAFRPSVSFLAYAGEGEPLGVVMSMEFDGDTAATGVRELYIQTIGTRAVARNRGIATALLATALTAAADAGFDRAALHVDADSPTGAVGLYERAGFSIVTTSVTMMKPMPESAHESRS